VAQAFYRLRLPTFLSTASGCCWSKFFVLDHPNKARYPNQRILIVAFDGYVYLVPFIEEADHFFLKTVIPSRKATRDYLKQGEPNVKN
jgi:hypothetical protein